MPDEAKELLERLGVPVSADDGPKYEQPKSDQLARASAEHQAFDAGRAARGSTARKSKCGPYLSKRELP